MFFKPIQSKYNKTFRGTFKVRNSFRSSKSPLYSNTGSFLLISKDAGRVSGRQIEACRKILKKHFPKKCQVWICTFPNHQVSSKGTSSRIGKGKGFVKFWVSYIQPGDSLFSISNVSWNIIKKAFPKVSYKVNLRLKVIKIIKPFSK